MGFTIYTLYWKVFHKWRARRFDLFIRLLQPTRADSLIDVGAIPEYWTQRPPLVGSIDALNVEPVDEARGQVPGYQMRVLRGDGCHLEMADRTYDIGFSNSVIEHVGSWERQQQFAGELRRVARALWVQTPAYECPIEPHYLTPFIHYLPKAVQKRILRFGTVYGWLERPSREHIEEMVETTRLLRKSEMRLLFPDCEIVTERILGFIPKSYIAVRRKGF